MNIVGLTGGIGCGKTTFTLAFEALDVPVIDADQLAHALCEPEQPGWKAITEHWGNQFLNKNGTLNREALREAVFHQPSLKQELEACLHPLIYKSFENKTDVYRIRNIPYLIWSIPLLFETKRYINKVNRILVIDVPVHEQIKRILKRGLPLSTAQSIIASQVSRAMRQAEADDLVINRGRIENIPSIVASLHAMYSKL